MDIEEEIKKISKRFNDGTETIEDILNCCRNYLVTFENGKKMRLVEMKYLDKLVEEYKKLLAEREEDKKRIKELEVLEDDLKDKRIVYVDTPEFEEKFIPKQKVKDKIEEIKEDKESKYFDKFLMTRDIDYAIEILEELLEDK